MNQILRKEIIEDNKFIIQDKEYDFPYHYIPYFDNEGIPYRSRFLGWSLDYLCYTKQIADFIIDFNPKSILDVGCGDGRFLSLLSSEISNKVGCDLSERAISFAKAFNPEIDYRCVNAHSLTDKFDVVTAVEVLEHIPDDHISKFVSGLYNCTNPGGKIIICVPSTKMKLQKKHYRHYDESLLDKHILLSGFDLKKITTVRVLRHRDIIYKLYQIITANNFFSIAIPALDKWMWSWIWRKRYAPKKGKHIISIYEKREDYL